MEPLSAKLEPARCALCAHSHYERVYSGLTDVRYGKPGEFEVVRCPNCGLCRLDPRPDARTLQDFYDTRRYVPYQDRPRHRLVLQELTRNWLSLPYRRRYGPLETIPPRPVSGCSMLDVGCGPGLRLGAMRAAGWNVWGVELDKRAAARAAERVGAPDRVIAGSIEEAHFPPQHFDLVTASHVLEHLRAPLGALGLIHDWLRPGGELIVWVPNFASLERRVFGRHWAALDVPRHLQHFSLASLTASLEATGFEVRSWRPQFQGSSLGDSARQAVAARFRRSGGPPATGAIYQGFTVLGWLLAGLGSHAAIEVRAVRS